MTDTFKDLFAQTDGSGTPQILRALGRSSLVEALGAMGFNRGAEIGVWEGGFAEKMCRANPNLHLICVDPWATQTGYLEVKNHPARMEAAYSAARARLKSFDCTFMRMTSIEAAAKVPDGSLDFCYIDGNHLFDHVIADLKAWAPKVRKGGVLAGHDYADYPKKDFIQVKRAVDHFTRERGINPWFVLANDKSPSYFWVVR